MNTYTFRAVVVLALLAFCAVIGRSQPPKPADVVQPVIVTAGEARVSIVPGMSVIVEVPSGAAVVHRPSMVPGRSVIEIDVPRGAK